MTLINLSNQITDSFESLNHHTVDLDDIVLKRLKQHFPLYECSKNDFEIGIHENFAWGETIFDITWTSTFKNNFAEVYPEAII